MESNYDVQKSRAAELIAATDLKAEARRLGLPFDEDRVYLTLLDLSCAVQLSDGYAEYRDTTKGEAQEADFCTAMILYDLLGYASETAHPSGEYSVIESFSKVQNARSYAGEGSFTEAAQIFEREYDKLVPAMEALGGIPYGKGDVSFRIALFRDLYMTISFWKADEDFPPSLIVGFDHSTPQYLHYETMWYAASLCIRRIMARFPKTALETFRSDPIQA